MKWPPYGRVKLRVVPRDTEAPYPPISRVVYVFFERDVRGDLYPLVYFNQALAEAAPRRASPVVRVEVPL